MRKRITVVTLNWNGKKDTIPFLTSLKNVKKDMYQFSCIVVDNGSTDGSVDVIKKAHPWVSVIETGKNLGFTGGNNCGIKQALANGSDFVWLLNNDTIVDTNAIQLVHAFDDPRVGAAGSKIYFAPGHEYHGDRYTKNERGKVFWYAGGIIDWDNMLAAHRGVDEVDKGQYDRIEETPFITGCSFMVAASVILELGMFDDKFYLYQEDLDWSLRIQHAGYKTVYFPKSIIWHVNAGSSGKPGNSLQEYYLTRNRLLIGIRYAPFRTKLALIREAGKILFSGNRNRQKAVLDALFGKFGQQEYVK